MGLKQFILFPQAAGTPGGEAEWAPGAVPNPAARSRDLAPLVTNVPSGPALKELSNTELGEGEARHTQQ